MTPKQSKTQEDIKIVKDMMFNTQGLQAYHINALGHLITVAKQAERNEAIAKRVEDVEGMRNNLMNMYSLWTEEPVDYGLIATALKRYLTGED